MHYKQTHPERDAKRTEREAEQPRQEPWRNTHPRGNQEPDRRDLERSLERFEALLGR